MYKIVKDTEKQSADTRNVLLALNIADDYFKAKKTGVIRWRVTLN